MQKRGKQATKWSPQGTFIWESEKCLEYAHTKNLIINKHEVLTISILSDSSEKGREAHPIKMH